MSRRVVKLEKRSLGVFVGRCRVTFLCVLLLPLPVPVLHRHDSFECSDSLTSHLLTRHRDHGRIAVDPAEMHWHFEMRAETHHGDLPADGNESGQPPASSAEYTASLSQGLPIAVDPSPWGDANRVVYAGRDRKFLAKPDIDGPRRWLIETAQHRQRSTHSRVMRC